MHSKFLRRHIVRWATWSAAAVLAAGCGPSRPPTAAVEGLVTFQGKPVSDATVVMMHKNGGRPATGVTDREGRFTLTTFDVDDGATLGEHVVTVLKKQLEITGVGRTPPEEAAGRDALSTPALGFKTKVTWSLPKRYADPDTSGLTIHVEPGMAPVTLELVP